MARFGSMVTRTLLPPSRSKAITVVLQLVAAAVSMVGTVLVLRRSGVETRGVLSAVLTVSILVPAFSVLSLDFAVPWYMRCYGTTPELSRVLRVARRASALASALISLTLLVLLPLQLSHATILLTSFGVGLAAPTLLRAGVLRASGRPWIDPLQGLVRATGTTVVAAVTTSIELLVASVAVSLAVAWATGEVVARIGNWPHTTPNGESSQGIPPPPGKTLIAYGGRLHFGTMAVLFTYRVDQLVILWVGTVSALGVYSTAVAISEALLLPVTALLPLLFVEESRPSGTAREGLGPLARGCLVFGGIAAATMFFSRHIVSQLLLPQPQSDDLADCMAWLSVATLAVCAWRVLSLVIAARGRPALRSYAAIPALLVTIAGNVALVPSYGASGAAAVSGAAYLIGLVLTIGFLRSPVGSRRA